MVEVKLKAVHDRRAIETAQQYRTWTDPATELMWTRQDNGSDVDANQAGDYCRNLTLGGYSNWRLPTIDELAGIYDQMQNVNGWHIKGRIRVTGWEWSSSTGGAPGETWYFWFGGSGQWVSHRHDDNFSLRALCVSRSGR